MEINCTEYDGKEITYDIDSLIKATTSKTKQIYDVDILFNKDDNVIKEFALATISDKPIITKVNDDKYEILDEKHRLCKAKICGQ